jgi:hypothetical protein
MRTCLENTSLAVGQQIISNVYKSFYFVGHMQFHTYSFAGETAALWTLTFSDPWRDNVTLLVILISIRASLILPDRFEPGHNSCYRTRQVKLMLHISK